MTGPAQGNGAAGAGQKSIAQPAAKGRQGWLWVRDGNLVKPLKVAIGPSDGTVTEVKGEEVTEGLEVITGEQLQAGAGEAARSPFAPTPIGGGKR